MRDNIIIKQKRDYFSFFIIFMLYLNGIFIESALFYIKPFQIFAPFLVLVFFAKSSLVTNKIKFQIHDLFFIFLFFLALISLIYSTNIDVAASLRLIGNLSILYLYYFFAKNLLAKKTPNQLVSIVLISSLIYSCLSLLVYLESMFNAIGLSHFILSHRLGFVIGGFGKIRMSGLEIDPNFFVLYLTPGLFLSLWSILIKHKVINKKLSYTVFISTFICLILSLSRVGILTNISLIFLTLLFIFKRIKFQHLIIISIIIIVLLNVFRDEILSRFELITTEFQPMGMNRYSLLLFGLDLFQKSPFFGLGFNQFAEYFSRSYGEIRYSHNTYLSVLVELGIIGLGLYLLFLFFLFRNLYLKSERCGNKNKWIYQAFIIILLSQCIQITSLYAISSSALWLSFILSSILILG
jgi:O-antigen ligase